MTNPEQQNGRGSSLVIGATLFAGLGGYAITTLMARSLGLDYGEFAVFWAVLYLLIGTIAGVQQEVTRGTPLSVVSGQQPEGTKLIPFALRIALFVFIGSSIILTVLGPLVFSRNVFGLSLPIVVGATLSVFVGALAGALYGTHTWRPLAFLIISDVIFRLLLLALTTSFTHDVVVLAWMTTVPFVLVIACVVPWAKKSVNISTALDVSLAQANRNVLRTIGASFGAALLVSGFPAMLALSENPEGESRLGPIIFALTLTRAPLVVGILALQSFLVVTFRDRVSSWKRILLFVSGGVLVAGLLLGVAAFFAGNSLLVLLAGPEFSLSPIFLAALTLSSVPTAWLAVTGAATLARNHHSAYTVGWLAAAGVGIAMLFTPWPIENRLIVALVVGPIVGVAIHSFSALARKDIA